MFTGLIEFVGKTLWLRRISKGVELAIYSPELASNVKEGDSVSVNGCCLTVTAHRKEQILFNLLLETLQKTNLKDLRPDYPVNLERAMLADGRFGGHLVQGHVDCTTTVASIERKKHDLRMDLRLPKEFAGYVAYKGSIAINGVSLTVAEVGEKQFSVWIIPHTLQHTNLDSLRIQDSVNLEFDILAKYVERLLTTGKKAH